MTQTLEPEHVDQVAAAAPARRRGPLAWSRRRQALAGGAVLAVLLAGGSFAAGAASVDARALPEYQALAQSNDTLTDRLSEVSQRNTALMEQAGEVSRRASEVTSQELAVAARERAVSKVEQDARDAQIAGSGTYVVGEDVKAGTYRSEGNDGCYYAFMTSTAADADIRDNNLGDGLMRVTLRDGDIFESSRCNVWNPA